MGRCVRLRALSERCRSGRSGRSRKPLCPLLGTVGSNPTLSANHRPLLSTGVSGNSKIALFSSALWSICLDLSAAVCEYSRAICGLI